MFIFPIGALAACQNSMNSMISRERNSSKKSSKSKENSESFASVLKEAYKKEERN